MAGRGSPTGGVKLCPMMTLAVRMLCLSLALCVAVSSDQPDQNIPIECL